MNVVSITLVTSSLALAIAGGLLVPNNMTSSLCYLMLASVIGVLSMVIIWGSVQTPERATEATKTNKFNMNGCFFLLDGGGMADVIMDESKVVNGLIVDTPVYLKVFDDYEALEAGEFLKELNIHKAK